MINIENLYHISFDIAGIHFDAFSTRKGISKLYLNANPDRFNDIKKTKLHPDDPFMFNIYTELKEYFNHQRKKFDVILDVKGTPFQKRVWKQLQKISFGEIVSYKFIAEKIRQPKAFRAVGHANALNPVAIIIPCHRVVNVDGNLGGYAAGLSIKEKLLELEGCKSLDLFNSIEVN